MRYFYEQNGVQFEYSKKGSFEAYEGINTEDENGNPINVVDVSALVSSGEAMLFSTQQEMKEAILYREQRAQAYPSIEEQLDMQYWDNINGTTVWQDTIDAIKSSHPKPE